MTTRRGIFAFILGAVAAAKLKPSPAWAQIMPPQPVAVVEVDDLLKEAWEKFRLSPTIVNYAIEYPMPLRTYDWGVDSEKVLAKHFPPADGA